MIDPASLPAQADVLFVATTDGAAVEAALDALAAEDVMERVEPESLWPLRGWWRGDEETAARRFLVAPAARGFATLLMSARDWDHDFARRLTERLGCRAAYLMLHDSDVFTCHLHDAGRCTLAWLSSPAHFDRDGEASLEGADAALSAFAARSLRPADVAIALAPPGRIDVDGRLAFARTHELLGFPAPPAFAYREALSDDRLQPLPAFSAWRHVAHRQRDQEPGGGERRARPPHAARDLPPGVVPFRPGR